MSLDEKINEYDPEFDNGIGVEDLKQSIRELMEANIIGRKMLLEKIKEIFGPGLI